MILADIQQFDTHILAKISLINQRLYAAPGRLDTLELRVMHDCVELTADLSVQQRNVFIQQGFVQAFDFMRRLFEQVQEYTDCRRYPFIGRDLGESLGVLKSVDAIQRRNRTEIDLGEQGTIDALAAVCVAGFGRLRGYG